MILDTDVFQHPRIADDLGELVADVRAVQAGGDEDRDPLARDAGGEHELDHRRRKNDSARAA